MSSQTEGLKALEIENLVKRRGKAVVLDNINLSLEIGEFMGLLGPAGAGKSTLLNILALWEKPDEGKFRILGIEPYAKSHLVFPKIGIWLEDDLLIPFLTAWQNLWLFSLCLGIPYRSRRAQISKYLNLAGIWEMRDRMVSSLSHKEKGLVNAVRILLNEPLLLILDEPERELDARGLHFLLQQINRLRIESNTAILWASSRGEWFEGADRVAIMKRGRIIACDTPLNLKKMLSKELPSSKTASPQTITLEEVFMSLVGERNG